jgi:hypothetical protein
MLTLQYGSFACRMVCDASQTTARDGGFVRAGFDSTLDAMRDAERDVDARLLQVWWC